MMEEESCCIRVNYNKSNGESGLSVANLARSDICGCSKPDIINSLNSLISRERQRDRETERDRERCNQKLIEIFQPSMIAVGEFGLKVKVELNMRVSGDSLHRY